MVEVYQQTDVQSNTNDILFSLELYASAMLYAKRLNCETFPLIYKKPSLFYKWRENRLGRAGVHSASLEAWQVATGVAVAPFDGDTLAIIDCDDPLFYEFVVNLLPILKTSFTVRRGDRCHIYVRLSEPHNSASYSDLNGREVASLRCAGQYVVGPHSLHPSGDKYIPDRNPVQQLDKSQTAILIGIFNQLPVEVSEKPVAKMSSQEYQQTLPREFNKRLIQELSAYFINQPRAYTRTDERGEIWINCQCPCHEYHTSADRKPSFGFNATKGYGHCFNGGCNRGKNHTLKQLARKVGINVARLGGLIIQESQKQYHQMITESGATQAKIIADLLDSDTRAVLTRKELISLCADLEWSASKSYKAIRAAVEFGTITEVQTGVYMRKSPVPLGKLRYQREAYLQHVKHYRHAYALDIERQLVTEVLQSPSGITSPMTSQKIALRVGVSKSTLYRYESVIGVQKFRQYHRYDLPSNQAEQPKFITQNRPGTYQMIDVVSRNGRTVKRLDPADFDMPSMALEQARFLAKRYRGKVVVCESRPSIRVLPGQHIEQMLAGKGAILTHSGSVYFDKFAWHIGGSKFGGALRSNTNTKATNPFKSLSQMLPHASVTASNRTKSDKPALKGFTPVSDLASKVLQNAQERRDTDEWKEWRNNTIGSPTPEQLKAFKQRSQAAKPDEQLAKEQLDRQRYWQSRDDKTLRDYLTRKGISFEDSTDGSI